MMPDLGHYAGWVLSAYAVTIAGLAAIVLGSILRAGRVRRQLAELEARQGRAGGAGASAGARAGSDAADASRSGAA